MEKACLKALKGDYLFGKVSLPPRSINPITVAPRDPKIGYSSCSRISLGLHSQGMYHVHSGHRVSSTVARSSY